MVTHMLALLESATSSAEPLQFIVIIPRWADDVAHQRLATRCGPHMRHHLIVPQRNHGYTEGAQWSKVDSRFRISTCDTSVFFLQTPKAASKWPVTSDNLQELTNSFRSKHRGQGEQRGVDAVGGSGVDAVVDPVVDPFKSKRQHASQTRPNKKKKQKRA